MPDIAQLTNDLRGLPDQALQQQLQQPNGMIPSYLVLAEAQRRQTMRQAAQQQQAKGDSSTVLQDVVRNMMSQQPPPGIAPAGMVPGKGNGPAPGGMPGGMPTPTPPQPGQQPPGMRRGGRYAEGDLVDEEGDDDTGEGNAPIPGVLTSRLLPSTRPQAQALTNRYTPTKYRPSPADIQGWIEKYSKESGVDPLLAQAMMEHESRGHAMARSPKGAMGLFQLMPGTADEMGVDPTNPEQNVRGGIGYFAKQLKAFNGDPELALGAYNAGAGAVRHYGGIPPFRETREYVPAIMARYNQLKGQNYVASIRQQQQAAPQANADAAAAATNPNAANAANDPNTANRTDAAPPVDPLAAAGVGQPPDIQPPGDTGTTFNADVYAPPPHGRIHQTLDELDAQRAAVQKQLDAMKDPYDPANMESQRQNILQFYGLPQNYLQSIDSLTEQKKAAIKQYQDQAMARYHNPNPWEFLANIAAGMGASKNLTFAGAFGEGVGHAWQVRDQQQQEAFNEWNALQQDADKIDATGQTARSRFDTVLQQILTHQGTVNEAQRKALIDQLSKNTVEQDKFKKMLVPTNAFQPLYNPGDYDKEDYDRAVKEKMRISGWNKDRMQKEIMAVQLLAQRGDPYQQGGSQFGSAYDQFIAKYPQEANKLLTPGKYSDADIKSFAETANTEPAALYDPHVVPKEAVAQVRAYMNDNGMRIPVQPPNKALHDSAALGGRTLTHLNRLYNFANDPWIAENVFGPWAGRMAKGEEQVGMDELGPGLKTANPQQLRDTQNLLTSLNYLRMIEGKGLLGGRPAVQLMDQLLKTTPDVHMLMPRFLGAMDATGASARMAIQADRDFMYGTPGGTNAIPAGAKVAQDKSGRRIMQKAPGQPWIYMDTNEPVVASPPK